MQNNLEQHQTGPADPAAKRSLKEVREKIRSGDIKPQTLAPANPEIQKLQQEYFQVCAQAADQDFRHKKAMADLYARMEELNKQHREIEARLKATAPKAQA